MTEEELYNKLVQEAESRANEAGYIEFDGWNCHDLDEDWNDGVACEGWDGQSRRCSCGNRRVYWALSLDKTHVYAEAY